MLTLLVLIAVLIVFAAVMENEGFLAAGALALFGVIVTVASVGFWEVVAFLRANDMSIFLGLVAYIAIGLSWMVFKWWTLARDRAEEWRRRGSAADRKEDFIPHPVRHLDALFAWAVFWWASMVGYFFTRFLRDIWRAFIERIEGILNKITERVFR